MKLLTCNWRNLEVAKIKKNKVKSHKSVGHGSQYFTLHTTTINKATCPVVWNTLLICKLKVSDWLRWNKNLHDILYVMQEATYASCFRQQITHATSYHLFWHGKSLFFFTSLPADLTITNLTASDGSHDPGAPLQWNYLHPMCRWVITQGIISHIQISLHDICICEIIVWVVHWCTRVYEGQRSSNIPSIIIVYRLTMFDALTCTSCVEISIHHLNLCLWKKGMNLTLPTHRFSYSGFYNGER